MSHAPSFHSRLIALKKERLAFEQERDHMHAQVSRCPLLESVPFRLVHLSRHKWPTFPSPLFAPAEGGASVCVRERESARARAKERERERDSVADETKNARPVTTSF